MTASPIGSGVPSYGIFDVDNRFTFLTSGITDKTGEGLWALSQDTTAAMTVKPAADGDPIIGQLYRWEDRTQSEGITVATVQLGVSLVLFQVKGSATVAVGDTVCGGGSGTVRTLAITLDTAGGGTPAIAHASADYTNRVVEVAPNGRTGFVAVLLK